MLPTDDDITFYRTHGYWISGRILPPELLDAAERGASRLYAGDTDRLLPDGTGISGWTPDDGDVLRKNDYASLMVDGLADVVRYPLVAACAARLSGADEIRLWHDQLLFKPPSGNGTANVGWHTDRQYWTSCTSTEMLTAWIPFHDVGEREGAVSFVAGSHRWPDDVVLDFFDPDLSSLDRIRAERDVSVVTARIPRGAMSFHHCRTVHGSGPNRGQAPRRSIAVHLQPGDNRYAGAGHENDRLVRRTADGIPDYADPAVCPRLWS